MHNPKAILGPFVQEGMKVVEPGPGMGFFTLELARMVGSSGSVVAVDVQAKMLQGLLRRAHRAGLAGRIDARLVSGNDTGMTDLCGTVDFVLAFAVVHEMPDGAAFFRDAAAALKPKGRLLLVEPTEVSAEEFLVTLTRATDAGLQIADRPAVRSSNAAILVKT